MLKYETVIVGAGPGGLQAAKTLAENNKSVLVLERNEKITRKICGGLWPLTKRTETFKVPNKIIDRKFKKILISTPNNKEYAKSNKPFLATLDRKKLSEWMTKQALDENAKIKYNACVTNVSKNHLVVNQNNKKEKIYFKYLIGADGSYSVVRKSLKLNSRVGMGIQYRLNKQFKDIEIHFDANKFSPWYSYILPHKKITYIGTAVHKKHLPLITAKTNLEQWGEEKKINLEKSIFEGAPISYGYSGYYFGNKFLVGDAAGISSELTGEGISFAMGFGEDVAKQIINLKYKPKKIPEILLIHKKHELLEKTFKISKNLQELEYNVLLQLLKTRLFEKELIDFCL